MAVPNLPSWAPASIDPSQFQNIPGGGDLGFPGAYGPSLSYGGLQFTPGGESGGYYTTRAMPGGGTQSVYYNAAGQAVDTAGLSPDTGSLLDSIIKYGSMAGGALAAGGGLAGFGTAGPGAAAVGGSGAAGGGGLAALGAADPLTYGLVGGSWGGAAGAPVAGDVGAGMGAALPGGAAAGGAGAGTAGGLTGADLAIGGGAAAGAGGLGSLSMGAGAGGGPLDALLSGASGTTAGLSDAAGGGGFLNSIGNFLGTPSGLLTAGQLGSSLLGGIGSYLSSQQQANAAQNATNAQLGMFNKIMGNLAPYQQAGAGALGQLSSYLNASPTGGPGGYAGLLKPFTAADLQTNLAPNYQFQLGQGLNQVQNAGAAAGGALSGNTLQGLNTFAQNYASNAYQQAFENYNTNQQNIYGRLGNLAQLGEVASTGGASGAPMFASGISQTLQGLGAANAAGTVGVTNALTGGANNLLGYYLLNQLSKGGSPFGS